MFQWRSEDHVLCKAGELQNASVLKSQRTAKASLCEPDRKQGFYRKREDIEIKKDRNEIRLPHNSAQGPLLSQNLVALAAKKTNKNQKNPNHQLSSLTLTHLFVLHCTANVLFLFES